jgi:signal transduction histidine kinase
MRTRYRFRPRLPQRSIQVRLATLFFAVFLVSGAALLAVTVLVWQHQTGVNPALGVAQHSSDRHQLLLASGIGLAIIAGLLLAVGWLVAGRFLQPLRTITAMTKQISATNLHERLSLNGPDDELKDLADTFDDLLGRLERSFAFERQFVTNASHELRTPLAAMRTSLDVAMAQPAPVAPHIRTLADRLYREFDHVDRLMESFLTLAHTQQGPLGDEATVSLAELADRAIERRTEAIARMRLDVAQQQDAEAWIAGSETLVSRMVENVIDNAVGHNQPGGWVGITTAVKHRRVVLVVENGGPLLDPGQVRLLAQPFRRIGGERTGSDDGSGLGLTIVSSIAEVHGGAVDLEAPVTGGLRVTITLPLAATTTARAPA